MRLTNKIKIEGKNYKTDKIVLYYLENNCKLKLVYKDNFIYFDINVI